MSFRKFIQKQRNSLFLLFTVFGLSMALLAGLFFNLNQNNIDQAQASDYNREVAPGERFEITFWYGNESGQDQGDTVANIEIRLGTTLEIEKIYEVFDTAGDGDFENENKYEICKDFMKNMPLTSANPLRKRMFYLPRSANNLNACSGTTFNSGTEFDSTVLPQGDFRTKQHFGKIVFEVRLREDVLEMNNLAATSGDGTYQVGDLLNVDNFQGGYVRFQAGVEGRESDIVPSEGYYAIKIGEPTEPEKQPLVQAHLPNGGLTTGQSFAQATNLNCSQAIAGQKIQCTGSLPEGYIAPTTGNLRLNVENQPQAVCDFSSERNFTCNNMEVGQETGQKKIQAAIENGNREDTGKTIQVLPSQEMDGDTYLLDASSIVFSPSRDNPAVFGQQDLGITVNHLANVSQCVIKVREHGSSSAWQTLVTTTNNRTCSTTFPKGQQNQHRWDFSIQLVDSNNHNWKSEPSYFMRLGAISIVEISACVADNC